MNYFLCKPDPALNNSIALAVTEGRHTLWGKAKKALHYIYQNHMDDADWFLKADDDTYVIVENLRELLAAHSSSEPIYFGSKLKCYVYFR